MSRALRLPCTAAVLLMLLVAPATASAAEPPPLATPVETRGLCVDEGGIDPWLARDFGHRLDMFRLGTVDPPKLIPGHVRGLPTTGHVKTFALLIDFADWKGKNTPTEIYGKLFGGGYPAEIPYESVRNYYERSSYGLLDIAGHGLGWYHYPGTRASVPETPAGRQALMAQALQAFDPIVDFSQYDNDHDGRIDYFIVNWAGPDHGMRSFWWGYKTSWDMTAGAVSFDGVTPDTYSWQLRSAAEGL